MTVSESLKNCKGLAFQNSSGIFLLVGLMLSFFTHVSLAPTCSSHLTAPKPSLVDFSFREISHLYIFHNSQLSWWRASAVQWGLATLSS